MKKLFTHLAAILFIIVACSMIGYAQQNNGKPAHNFGGKWALQQSNGIIVELQLKHDGFGDIQGTAIGYTRGGNLTGKVKGRSFRTNGPSGWQSNVDHFQIEIDWNGHVGIYNGSASWAEGNLRGITHHKGKPSSKVTWTAGPFPRKR